MTRRTNSTATKGAAGAAPELSPATPLLTPAPASLWLPEWRPGDGLITVTMDVTPEIARHWLDHCNPLNRRQMPVVVRRYAGDLTRGAWRLTHQGFGFNQVRHLVDGQHRAAAVVLSGMTLRTQVTVGISDEARACIDVGAGRKLAQILEMLYGVRNSNAVVSFVNAIELMATNTTERLTADAMLTRLEIFKPGLEWWVGTWWGKDIVRKLASAPFAGALIYAHRANPEGVAAFMQEFMHGGASGSVAMLLRNMLSLGAKHWAGRRRELALITLRAVFAHANGERLVVLRPSDQVTEFFTDAYEG